MARKKNHQMTNKTFTGLCLGLILVLGLGRCTPPLLEIPLEAHEPRPVVSSQIIPEKEMVISLTRSFSPLSSPVLNGDVNQQLLDDILIKNAEVTVSYLGQTDTLHMISPGIYSSDLALSVDFGTYTLHASDPLSGQQVMAVSTMLPKIGFDTIWPVIHRGVDDTTIVINYVINDDPSVDNWYVVAYYNKALAPGTTNLDINSYFGRGTNRLSQVDLLSDKFFDNGTYSSEVVLEDVGSNDTIAVVVSNISKGYFEFLHTFNRSGDILNQLTGEPINYPSNVSGGYGYFNTHNPDAKIFDLNKY